MIHPNTANATRASKQPTSPAEFTTEGTFFTVFERLCERITSFVSGHWEH